MFRAFITIDISFIEETLKAHNVFYTKETPHGTGIEQLFFFDPDGNVIEVINVEKANTQQFSEIDIFNIAGLQLCPGYRQNCVRKVRRFSCCRGVAFR